MRGQRLRAKALSENAPDADLRGGARLFAPEGSRRMEIPGRSRDRLGGRLGTRRGRGGALALTPPPSDDTVEAHRSGKEDPA